MRSYLKNASYVQWLRCDSDKKEIAARCRSHHLIAQIEDGPRNRIIREWERLPAAMCTLGYKTKSTLAEHIHNKIRCEVPLVFSGALERKLQF